MKAYRGVDGRIRTFRPDMNMERMNRSAARAGLPTFSGPELVKCLNRLVSIDQEWVPHSESSSLYIRPTYIGIDVSIEDNIASFLELSDVYLFLYPSPLFYLSVYLFLSLWKGREEPHVPSVVIS